MLEGVKVLSFTHYLQGPSVVQASAGLGVDVIKVGSYRGVYKRGWSGRNTYKSRVSAFYLMANHNQGGVTLGLKSDEGRGTIYRLVRDKEYDVILEDFRPETMDELSSEYEELRKLDPGAIYCSCTGYGLSEPKVREPKQDLLVQGMSGLAALAGPGDHPPIPIETALVDQHGAILAILDITTAVHDRNKTGERHHIEVSLLGSVLSLQVGLIGYYLNSGTLTSRADTGLSTRTHQSPYGVYRAADKYITLSLTSFENSEQAFTPGVLEGFSTKDRMNDRIKFNKVVYRELLRKATSEWGLMFEELGIRYMPINKCEDVVKDEQIVYNRCFVTIDRPVASEVKVLGRANRYDR